MFYLCSSLKELKITNYNTYIITNMSSMFYGCSSLKDLNITNFNTNNAIYIDFMFLCSSLK